MHHYDLFEPIQVSPQDLPPMVKPEEAAAKLAALLASKADCGAWQIADNTYAAMGRDARQPILFAGSLAAHVCVLGRDLGSEEVLLGEPLVGPSGHRLRRALHICLFGSEPDPEDATIRRVLPHVLLANTVPYKPVGNRPFSRRVREAVRPVMEAFLRRVWQGHVVVTLGSEAFHWFEPYCPPGVLRSFWARPDRFEALLECSLASGGMGRGKVKPIVLAPLPHPSPRNRKYFWEFEDLVARRWEQAKAIAAQADEHPQADGP
ncbi:MAG: uracil-DNA glycosylase family protein [Chthonomonadales bacterium]